MDEKYIDKIYDEYFTKVYFYVKRILAGVGTNEDIEECVSDVFLDLWKNWSKYDNSRGSLQAYIYVKTKTVALNYRKRLNVYGDKYKQEIIENNSIAEKTILNTEEMVIDNINEKRILRAIDNFKEPNRSYFYLRYFMNYDIKSIANIHNTTVSAVENRLYRCRIALKKILGKEIV